MNRVRAFADSCTGRDDCCDGLRKKVPSRRLRLRRRRRAPTAAVHRPRPRQLPVPPAPAALSEEGVRTCRSRAQCGTSDGRRLRDLDKSDIRTDAASLQKGSTG